MINNVIQNLQPFEKCTSKKVSLTAGNSVAILNANLSRMYVAITNISASTITVILGEPSNTALNQGILLMGRGSSFEITQLNWYGGKVSALSSNISELSIVECER